MAKYNSKIIKEMCGYIADGCSNKDASLLAGISEETFYTWLKDKPELSESLKKAEIKRKRHLLKIIFDATNKHWTAAAWYLERVYPNEYGNKREFVERVKSEDLHRISPELSRAIRRMAENKSSKISEKLDK